MPRKRKAPINRKFESVAEEENETSSSSTTGTLHGPMYTIMSNVQLNETFHNKYIKEMHHLYNKMDHDAFMFTFIKMIKSAMEADETNEYALTTLLFCGKYVSSYEGEVTHPVLIEVFNWVLKTYSTNHHIRFRLCQFINIILNALSIEAALDDNICDNIMSYMLARLRDVSPHVRVQAILALQRLQVPDNPDDVVVKAYQFHLSSDPSPRVRQAVISSIGRNYNTIPYILDRLWDIDEKVRRHTYLNMSSYPVKSYTVAQRLTFLEQGLYDRSDMVRKVITNVMLPHWLESYNKNYISFITALKIDANEIEMERFIKITKVALGEMFKREKIENLIDCLPLQLDEENEFFKCISVEKLTVESSLYWLSLIELLQLKMADEIDDVIPELSKFCTYILRYCGLQKFTDEDKWKKMEFQYILLTLIEILYTFDLGDEIGRENLKNLIPILLKTYDIEQKCIEMIIKCAENLISNQEDRLNFFVDIVKEISNSNASKSNDILNNRELVDEYLEKHPDKDLKLKLSSLKVKILDLEEQEMNFVERKDYVEAQKISEETSSCKEEYTNLILSLMSQTSSFSGESIEKRPISISFHQPKKITAEEIIKCLQISFFMVVSKKVKSLTPNVHKLYTDFIRRHIESAHITVRDWALKCGTAYSMLYEQLAKDVYQELYSQFFKNQNIAIWKTSIECLFELLDRYGFEAFESSDKQNKSKKPGRQLYNTMEFLDQEDQDETTNLVDIIFMISHILDTCQQLSIIEASVKGLCRLVLHGHIKNNDIVEKLLLKYFNPVTESEVNQILGVFFENLIQKKKQEYLQPCLLPTITTILSAPYDSPLHEIKPETVLRFVIDSTRPQFCSIGLNIHNTIALSFMQEMQNNIANKELAKLLSKEILSLEIATEDDGPLRNDLRNCCEKLLQGGLDPKTTKNIINFKDILDGKYEASTVQKTKNGSDEENIDLSDEETEVCEKNLNDKEKENETLVESFSNPGQNPEKEKESVVDMASTTNINNNTTNVNISSVIPPNNDEHSTPRKTLVAASKPLGENSTDTQILPNESNLQDELEKTPTTFGQNNATNMRYLRKSMNIRRSQPNISPTKKIRIEARIQANVKGIQEIVDTDPDNDLEIIGEKINKTVSQINRASKRINSSRIRSSRTLDRTVDETQDISLPCISSVEKSGKKTGEKNKEVNKSYFHEDDGTLIGAIDNSIVSETSNTSNVSITPKKRLRAVTDHQSGTSDSIEVENPKDKEEVARSSTTPIRGNSRVFKTPETIKINENDAKIKSKTTGRKRHKRNQAENKNKSEEENQRIRPRTNLTGKALSTSKNIKESVNEKRSSLRLKNKEKMFETNRSTNSALNQEKESLQEADSIVISSDEETVPPSPAALESIRKRPQRNAKLVKKKEEKAMDKDKITTPKEPRSENKKKTSCVVNKSESSETDEIKEKSVPSSEAKQSRKDLSTNSDKTTSKQINSDKNNKSDGKAKCVSTPQTAKAKSTPQTTKRMERSKNNVTENLSFSTEKHSTRKKTREEFILNNVMTRNRRSISPSTRKSVLDNAAKTPKTQLKNVNKSPKSVPKTKNSKSQIDTVARKIFDDKPSRIPVKQKANTKIVNIDQEKQKDSKKIYDLQNPRKKISYLPRIMLRKTLKN